MINTLIELINYLYPSPQYGILVQNGNNPPISDTRTREAVVAIAEAQRINRTNNYDLSGLCEFHIGIIYAHWGNLADAQQQFVLARRQWKFSQRKTAVSQSPSATKYAPEPDFIKAICLTHFAEGYAQETKFAYEKAISAYHNAEQCLQKAEQCVPETKYPAQRTRQCAFLNKLNDILKVRVACTHRLSFAILRTDTLAQQQQKLAQLRKQQKTQQQRHQQQVNILKKSLRQQQEQLEQLQQAQQAQQQNSASPPIDNINPEIPTPSPPAPIYSNPYHWHHIDRITNNKSSKINADTFLLIDNINAHTNHKNNELVLIKHEQNENVASSLKLGPPPPFKRIYLAIASQTGSFIRNISSDSIGLSSNHEERNAKHPDTIGLIIGIWHTPHFTPEKQSFLPKALISLPSKILTHKTHTHKKTSSESIQNKTPESNVQEENNTSPSPVDINNSPLPDDINNGNYRWYRTLHFTKSDEFPYIEPKTYLLINIDNSRSFNESDLLLVRNEGNEGNIRLKPCTIPHPFDRIYLDTSDCTSTFNRNIFNGSIKFPSEPDNNDNEPSNIIGVVIGIWCTQVSLTP